MVKLYSKIPVMVKIHPPSTIFSLLFSDFHTHAAAAVAAAAAAASGMNSNSTSCINEEIEVLLQFKHGIAADNCGLLDSWGSDHHVDCCRWQGVRCSNRSDTDNHVNVIGLDLHGFITSDVPEQRCLQGKVSPNSLDKLKQLEYLDLSSNNFQSQPIPSFFGSLVNLKHLNLSQAGFAGELPHQLGNLSALTSLDLNNDGYVDDLYANSLKWLSRLNLLRYIDLTGVALSATTDFFQVVTNLPSLRVLDAGYCSLSSPNLRTLPFINTSSSLSVVTLAGNQCNGTFMLQWLFNLSLVTTHLEYIDISGNSISGAIPRQFWNNTQKLSYLDLSSNSFEGPIPDTISTLKYLTHLDLSSSYTCEGARCLQLPNTLQNLCSLQTLFLNSINMTIEFYNIIHALSRCAHKSLVALELTDNQVWGSIPDIISTFSSLRSFLATGNQLNGTISKNLGQVSMLETLSLNKNSLQGTLSNQHLSNLSRLTFLDVSDNPNLVINISSEWIPPFQLDKILMRSTMVGPDFPMWVLTQTNFSQLDVSNAGISDTIPPSLWRSLSPNLEYLSFSNNSIHGDLSLGDATFNVFPQFPRIELSFNFIQGTVPSFPRNISGLFLDNNIFTNATPLLCPNTKMVMSNLYLSNNMLSGELPNCWTNYDRLSVLNLENNHFSGSVPESIGALKSLQLLQLRNNSFTGKLPTSLMNCTSLVILDVGYNSLTGHIPTGIGIAFKGIVVLNLRSNNFHGKLPSSLCKLSSLQILDLAGNNLSGTIPRCINNLKALATMEAFLPFTFQVLNYTYNTQAFEAYQDTESLMWKGREWSFSKSLGLVKSIDISNNHLEGPIPNEISSLIALVSLDLSRNNLTGSITPDIGRLSSLEVLDLSSNNLFGHIPPGLAKLSSLAVLGLANNNLSGQIPTGTQLQGFGASSYIGNPLLCGAPLPTCSKDQAAPKAHNRTQEENIIDKDDFFPGLYISIVLGFIVGFWGVCGTLVLKNSWRFAFFRFIHDMKDGFWRSR